MGTWAPVQRWHGTRATIHVLGIPDGTGCSHQPAHFDFSPDLQLLLILEHLLAELDNAGPNPALAECPGAPVRSGPPRSNGSTAAAIGALGIADNAVGDRQAVVVETPRCRSAGDVVKGGGAA